jgi:hypothetical protein
MGYCGNVYFARVTISAVFFFAFPGSYTIYPQNTSKDQSD